MPRAATCAAGLLSWLSHTQSSIAETSPCSTRGYHVSGLIHALQTRLLYLTGPFLHQSDRGHVEVGEQGDERLKTTGVLDKLQCSWNLDMSLKRRSTSEPHETSPTEMSNHETVKCEATDRAHRITCICPCFSALSCRPMAIVPSRNEERHRQSTCRDLCPIQS